MKIIETLSMWRKILIAILSLLMIVSAIIIGNLHSIIHYNYKYVKEWNYNNLSHIGNINRVYNDYGELKDNWVNIGNRNWYSSNLENVDSDKELGDLIRLYSYRISDSRDSNYGETASLWIYDISEKCLQLGMNRESFYNYLIKEYTKDSTSIWKSSDYFRPFMALTTGPFIIIPEGENLLYQDFFIIFANDRVYSFVFANDKFNNFSPTNDDLFDKRCKSVIGDTDFMSYTQWEKEYYEYKELSEKQDHDRELWGCILYGIVFICCICIFILNIRTIGKVNNQARLLAFYVIACLAIGMILMAIGAFDSPCKDDTLAWLVMVFLPSFVIYMLIFTFLSKKSKEAYNTYYLIPDEAARYLNINTEYSKRLALLFIFYPLFFIIPIPVLGLIVFLCYILPIIAILLLRIGIKRIYSWIKEGKKKDITSTIHHEEIARLYCRHCGKLIDADSDYCRYCGKKL